MHIIIKNEAANKVEGVLCVDRETQTCTILQYTEKCLEDLVQIAKALKVPRILMFAPPDSISELKPMGWMPVEDPILLKKGD